MVSYKSCERCGAVIAVSSSEGGGFDNEEGHAGWHAVLDDLLNALAGNRGN
jgi:hypothetical protein